MKKIIILFFLCIINFFIFSKKQTYSIVSVNAGYVPFYKSFHENSEKIGEVPVGTKGLISTWKTVLYAKEYWIQIVYKNETGWLKRRFITKNYDTLEKKEFLCIENVLIQLTSSIQQVDYTILKKYVYSIRGLFIYHAKKDKLFFCERGKLNILWENISKKNTDTTYYPVLNNFFSEIILLLENYFDIHFNPNKKLESLDLPVEIKNFNCIILENKTKKVYLGIEFWNNKPYISYIALFDSKN